MTEYDRPPADRWSEPVNGLTGRLRIEAEDADSGRRHAVNLELRNETPDPITVGNLPRVDAEVNDDDGEFVEPGGMVTSGPEPILRWMIIPVDAYLGFRIDLRTVGIPPRESGTALLAFGVAAWRLRPGSYTVQATVSYSRSDDAPTDQWVGELELPAVNLAVG